MPFARPLARWLWYGLLWLMRRPWIKAARRGIPNWLPPSKRERAWNRIVAQDRWALKHGLGILTIAMHVLLASIFVQVVYYGFVWMDSQRAAAEAVAPWRR